MNKTALTILAVTSTLGGMVQANAATITASYDFTASGFKPSGISPVDPWTGSFTITFDPAVSGRVGPLALDAFSSNLPASYGTFEFVYNGAGSVLCIQEFSSTNFCSVTKGTDEAFSAFFPVTASGGLTFAGALIASTSSDEVSGTDSGTVTMRVAAPATPLPAALPLFATGLGALGLLGWRRKRKARVSLLGVA
jgi:hypothetical protein